MTFRRKRKKKDRRKFRGTYLIPNLITTGSLFAGFYAIVASINERYEAAAIVYPVLELEAAFIVLADQALGEVLVGGPLLDLCCFLGFKFRSGRGGKGGNAKGDKGRDDDRVHGAVHKTRLLQLAIICSVAGKSIHNRGKFDP